MWRQLSDPLEKYVMMTASIAGFANNGARLFQNYSATQPKVGRHLIATAAKAARDDADRIGKRNRMGGNITKSIRRAGCQ